jgi:hypothetical protein
MTGTIADAAIVALAVTVAYGVYLAVRDGSIIAWPYVAFLLVAVGAGVMLL